VGPTSHLAIEQVDPSPLPAELFNTMAMRLRDAQSILSTRYAMPASMPLRFARAEPLRHGSVAQCPTHAARAARQAARLLRERLGPDPLRGVRSSSCKLVQLLELLVQRGVSSSMSSSCNVPPECAGGLGAAVRRAKKRGAPQAASLGVKRVGAPRLFALRGANKAWEPRLLPELFGRRTGAGAAS
jgi:hypothetical protein